jgi:hypothetical protein
LLAALSPAVFYEDMVKPKPEQTVQGFEHYELVTRSFGLPYSGDGF